jgi:hypothetical protein
VAVKSKQGLAGATLCFAAFVSAAEAQGGDARTEAEAAAGVAIADPKYPELDIRRYGAVCDYDAKVETAGWTARRATDNLPAFKAAIAVAAKKGGGTIRVETGGDCYVSNSIDARGIDNLWFHVAAGTTVRATRYTNMGTLFILGNTDAKPAVRNVGIRGGGTLRTYRPDHASIAAHKPKTAYAVGDYVLSTDTNREKRAYCAKRAGVSGPASPPDKVNGSDQDGTVVWQDADNDNVISISGVGASVIGMKIPEASGKPITFQKPSWRKVRIADNVIGKTNDKAIEVKGQHGLPAQRNLFGEGVYIVGNVIDEAGREGIEIEQSANGVNSNRDCHVVGNLVRAAGVINGASGIRVNRCDDVEIRGNRVLRAGGNGYHIRRSRNVVGDLTAENIGQSGVHLQEVDGFSFDAIAIKNARRSGVAESGNVRGGKIGKLTVEGAEDGYRASQRKGPAPVIDRYSFAKLSRAGFTGARPKAQPSSGMTD